MVAPNVLPGRGYRPITRRSRLPFHWRADDLSLEALTGQSLSFSRAGVGGAVPQLTADDDGDLVARLSGQFASNQPRWVMRQINGVWRPALATQLSRKNHHLWSEEFDRYTTGSEVSITADQVSAPDGATTGDEASITGTTGGNATMARTNITGLTAETTYTYSFYAKAGTSAGNVNVLAYDNSNDATIDSKTYTPSNYTDWTRVSLTFTTPAGCTKVYLYSISNPAQTGTLYLWGGQLEAGGFATSYLKTEGSTVTAPVETLSHVIPSAIESPSTPWTWYGRWVAGMDQNGGISLARILQIGDGASANKQELWLYLASTSVRMRHANTGGTFDDAIIASSGISTGDTCEAIIQWLGTGVATLYLWVSGTYIDSATLSGITPASAWEPDANGDVRVYYHSREGGSNAGAIEWLTSKFKRGTPTATTPAGILTELQEAF